MALLPCSEASHLHHNDAQLTNEEMRSTTLSVLCVTSTLLRLTSPLTPHKTPQHNTPQSLWRTSQQIASLEAHTHHYGPILVACTARDFLRGCSGIEAFSIEDNRCDCVLEGLNASLVDRGDGTALLRVAIDEGATRPVLGGRALPKRPPRASRFIN